MPGSNETWLHVDLATQRLTLFEGGAARADWRVSTGRNGPGEQRDSGCTPRGEHRIRIKIGADCPENTVFVGRRPTGEVYSDALAARAPLRDWILTRVLWLSGSEPGFNRGGSCDTLRRYIYIHGCPDSEPMGVPASHGCIRMRNRDIIELFEHVAAGTRVLIREHPAKDHAQPG